MTDTTVYSLNGQDCWTEHLADVLSELEPGVHEYYSATKVVRNASDYMTADDLLEFLQQRIDYSVDLDQDAINMTEHEVSVLNADLVDLLNKHITLNFYEVKNVVKHILQKEEIPQPS